MAMFQVALISDSRHLVDGMARFSTAPVTWLGSTVQLVMSGELGAWPEPPYVLWIDVPCAAVTQSVKLTKLREILTQAVQKACEQSCPVILMKREFDGAEKLVEHWHRLKKKWALMSTRHCTCRYHVTLGKSHPHFKYVIYIIVRVKQPGCLIR